MKPNSQRV